MSEISEVQSTLQLIRSDLGEIKAELRSNRREMDSAQKIQESHALANREDFLRVWKFLETDRKEIDKRFTDQTEDRQRHMGEQDIKLDGLIRDRARAGWVILGIVGFIGTILSHIGSAVWSSIESMIHIKIG